MKQVYLLDTNIFSYIVNGDSPAARNELLRLQKDPDATLCISSITEAELRYGIAKRPISDARRQAIDGLLANLEILPWGTQEAATYGTTRAALEARGLTVSEMDMLIAVHAISIDAVLVAADHIFPLIAELGGLTATVNWATDL